MDAPTRNTPASSPTPNAREAHAHKPDVSAIDARKADAHKPDADAIDPDEPGAPGSHASKPPSGEPTARDDAASSGLDSDHIEAHDAPPRPPATLDDLDATLGYLERLCGRLEQAESRFKQLTDECEGVLRGLVAVDRRHATTIANLNDRLGDWCHLESKLLEESARRIEQFERGVGHEWMVLRQLHEEPLVQLKDDADQLRMACLEAARTARHRFDSVEKAYTEYAEELDRRLTAWSRELLGAVASTASAKGQAPALPAGSTSLPAAAPAAVEPWPLEGVAQLHHEIRTGTPPTTVAAAAPPAGEAPVRPSVTKRAAILFGVVVLLVVALGGYAVMRARSSVAAVDATTAQGPTQETAVSRAPTAATAAGAPADKLSEAQRAAERAGTMVDILAAADLRRYALAGATPNAPNQPYGQVLWSRSRGLAASASRLPAPPDGKVYRLWIVPDGPAVSAGVLMPDAAGRASLLVSGPLKLPAPVTIRVTLEDKDETTSPKGPVCLVRVPGV